MLCDREPESKCFSQRDTVPGLWEHSPRVLRRAITVWPAVVQLIQREMGHWDENSWICLDDVQELQYQYVQSLLEAEKGELTKLELEVHPRLERTRNTR